MTTGRAGSGSSRVDSLPAVRKSLRHALGQPAPLKRLAARVFSGPKESRHHGAVKHDDEVVLEVRRLHEQAHLPPTKILAHLVELGVDINLGDVKRYADYRSRALLIPAENATPYIDRIGP